MKGKLTLVGIVISLIVIVYELLSDKSIFWISVFSLLFIIGCFELRYLNKKPSENHPNANNDKEDSK